MSVVLFCAYADLQPEIKMIKKGHSSPFNTLENPP